MRIRRSSLAFLLAISLLVGVAVPGAGAATAAASGDGAAPEPIVYRASAGFSGTQGGNGWHYWKQRSGVRSDLVYAETPTGNPVVPRWKDAVSNTPWISATAMHPGASDDVVRAWKAPSHGTVGIGGSARKGDNLGDGVLVSIEKNDAVLWSAHLTTTEPSLPTGVESVPVAEGDIIAFVVRKNVTLNNDHTNWDPIVTFTPGGGNGGEPGEEAPDAIPVAAAVNTRGGPHADVNQKMLVANGSEFVIKHFLKNGATDAPTHREGYLQADFGILIGRAEAVDTVTMNVYVPEAAGKDVPITIRGLQNAEWTESEITYNNAPAEPGVVLDTVVVNNAGWYRFDVTSYVLARIEAGLPVVSFRVTDDAATDTLVRFRSNDASEPELRPYLSLDEAGGGDGRLSRGTVANLPESFYARPGLEGMPRIDYASMYVADVKKFGAAGDGETNDREAFDRAIAALEQVGGGIVYMPAGRYYFAATPPPGTDARDRRFWDRTDERALENIHFVGEGDATTIVFRSPGLAALPEGQLFHTANGAYNGRPYGWRIDGVNISFRSFGTSWSPRLDMRAINGPYNIGLSGENIQAIDLNVDQGAIGIVFWQGTKNVWAVDNEVRNTGADGIHFANVVNAVAAYNYTENINDDAIGFVSDAPGTRGWPVSENNFALHNTIVRTTWGRGVSAGGIGHRIEGNWIESSLLAGVFTNSLGQAGETGVPVERISIKNNTILRSDQNNRADNNFNQSHLYRGAIAMNNLANEVTIEDNRIFGTPGSGILLSAWGSALRAANLAIRGNEIADSAAGAIKINNNATIHGLDISNNRLLGNANSVLFGGTLSGETYAGNLVSQPTVPAKEGFEVSAAAPSFTDIYDAMENAPNETAWANAPEVNVPETIVNVKAYGAKGDGTGNDLVAFYDALDAIPETGGVLYVPQGIYNLEPIAERSNVPFTAIRHHLLIQGRSHIELRGDGEGSVLRFRSEDHQGIRLLGANQAKVTGLRLELADPPTQRHNRALLDVSASTGVEIDGVRLVDSGGPGLLVDASTGVAVRNSRVDGAGTAGIEILGSRQVFVEDSTIAGARDSGIHLNKLGAIAREPQYVRLQGNRIEGSRDHAGISIASGNHIEIQGNLISDTHMAGILLYYTSEAFSHEKVKVVGNTLVNTNSGPLTYHYGAITVQHSRKGDLEVHSNRIQGTPYSGFAVDRSTLTRLQLGRNVYEGVGGEAVLLCPPNAQNQACTIASFVDLDRTVNVNAIKPKLLDSNDWQRWAVEVELENIGETVIDGEVVVTVPYDSSPVPFTAAPGEIVRRIIEVPADVLSRTEAVPLRIEARLPGGITVPAEAAVNFLAAAKTIVPPSVDGDLREWEQAMAFRLESPRQYKTVSGGTTPWGGIADLSGSGMVMWDDESLYLAAAVRDNVHRQGQTDGAAWMGDSIQFMIDPGRVEGPGSKGYSELLFALADTGDIVKWRWASVAGRPIGSLANSEAAIVRDGDTTKYEIRIPWSELLPAGEAAPESLIGFSFLANDDDGPGRHGWLEYMSGIGSGKNAALFGDLTLAPAPPVQLEHLQALLDYFAEAGELEHSLYAALRNSAMAAKQHAEKERFEQAAKQLEDFVKHIERPSGAALTPQAEARLKRTAETLIAEWRNSGL
ncbi:right-handed parallel beta-helix repeat-containing protein [Paenibacillus sp.]|uniref:right-handed parallel beta-helix repeat-containing protein n=1 Tax=Paenibacillus sp. TaxID=58172 RepID=UPI002D6BB401|nr:glycosyl hydrolase family 28-related protein [Paenibacillus sp.]HZG86470.1 glycosyl hydrolase family 28-related protein [Paenibacillus sp.]